MVLRPSGDRRSGDRRASATSLAKPCTRQCRVGGGVSKETNQVWVKARSKTATTEVDSQHALNTREKKTLSVKACCTAPILNPNQTTQNSKASPKRPQFF